MSREKNGLLTSLDKERKENLLKKSKEMMTELDEKIKFLEIAEQLLTRKSDIVEVQNSITTLLDDFNNNWETEGPQALRFVFNFVGVRISNFRVYCPPQLATIYIQTS